MLMQQCSWLTGQQSPVSSQPPLYQDQQMTCRSCLGRGLWPGSDQMPRRSWQQFVPATYMNLLQLHSSFKHHRSLGEYKAAASKNFGFKNIYFVTRRRHAALHKAFKEGKEQPHESLNTHTRHIIPTQNIQSRARRLSASTCPLPNSQESANLIAGADINEMQMLYA